MAADVSYFAEREEGEGKRELVTRDLLGGGGVSLKSAEVDLELRVPDGWERRLDLVSGKTYLQKRELHPAHCHQHNLNLALPPPSTAELFPEVNAGVPPSRYQSVCTLEKVRSALQRAGHRPYDSPLTPSSPSTGVDCSAKRMATGDRELDELSPAIARCPGCLLYVLVSPAARRCPRCAAHLAVDGEANKRHKFDLNSPNH
ncbi:hypothetical protein ZIOFF_040726 [Zingiber officinale]|uniref:Uncharacterized protein n=2 Tax=Zingiber officinale TaxID=94328 RepID=A0A8J5G4H3_ZINOF|nr:hypothetical protein ZIOFF_040726 [Zingiber officinale]